MTNCNWHLTTSFFLITFLRLVLLFPVSWPNSALCLAGVPRQRWTDAVFLRFLPLPVQAMPDVCLTAAVFQPRGGFSTGLGRALLVNGRC